jgi:DNA-binding transcriptional LysR family regulator
MDGLHGDGLGVEDDAVIVLLYVSMTIVRIHQTTMQETQQSAGIDTPVFAELSSFVAVAETLSFSRAGERLNRDATAVSRRLGALEARLGVRLVERTTRSVTLTEAGRTYLERAREILRQVDEADREATLHATGEPRGHLRLALPDSFGRLWLAPLLVEFLRAHPRITIEAEFSNRFVDIVGERFDLAVRLGELGDSRLVARRVCARRRLLCAAPGYLAQHGSPRQPEDLARHACLVFTGLAHRNRWDLADAQGVVRRVPVSGPLATDNAEVLVEAATAGLGVMLATDWLVGRQLQDGRLVRLLPQWQVVDEGAVFIVTPSGSAAASKTRAFSDWLAARLADPPWARTAAPPAKRRQANAGPGAAAR